MLGVAEEKKEEKPILPQSEDDQAVSNRIFQNFLKWRDNRNRPFDCFRNRTLLEYIDDCNRRFNNYRVRPDWKDNWQANISDTTTHAKLMAIVAQQIVNNFKPLFKSRFGRDIFSGLRAQTLQDIYDFTESNSGEGTRDGEFDTLFMTLKACREGTAIGFEGYKKTAIYEGIDAQFVPLEDFYPADMTKFFMQDQPACIWRSVVSKDFFDANYGKWYQAEKVRSAGEARTEENTLFNISDDIQEEQVELLRYLDKVNDEFYVTANSILLTRAPSKLSTRRQDKELGFWKAVFEIYDDNFFYGRSLPDIMSDSQDAIDFLFNAMFDKEILSVLRPILIGGVNEMVDDYIAPNQMIQVSDITQAREMALTPPDLTAFRVLKELQDRQHFVSVDQVSQGVALGRKTATEVERAQEAARRLNSVFSVMLRSALVQKARLRAAIILQYLIKSPKFKDFLMENVKLFETSQVGTRILRLKPSRQALAPRNQLGVSPRLQMENMGIKGPSEIFELTPEIIADFEYSITTTAPSSVEMSPGLKRAYDVQWVAGARGNPQYDQEAVEKTYSEAMDKDWETVRVKEKPAMPLLGEGSLAGVAKPTKEIVPTLREQLSQIT